MSKIAAIVLAAGLSRRYGTHNKLLRQIDGQAMIRVVVEALLKSPVETIVVVTGYQSGQIEKELDRIDEREKLQLVLNEDYDLGMSTSISRGAHYLEGMHGCLICLGDMPFLTTDDYRELIDLFDCEHSPNRIIIPTFEGTRGHPVFFGSLFFQELQELHAHDQGAREVILNNSPYVTFLPLQHNRILQDIDFRTLE